MYLPLKEPFFHLKMDLYFLQTALVPLKTSMYIQSLPVNMYLPLQEPYFNSKGTCTPFKQHYYF